jgi:3-phenylpropionate/cinnamic acid dioxygenase small subunit
MSLATVAAAGEAPASASMLSVKECEDFLVHEARLLDDARFDEWLALFTPKATYWVPSEPDQQSPLDTVSLMYDDRRLLETRIRRLASPRIYSQEPRSRTSRVVTNVTVETAPEIARRSVRSKFMIVEYRRDQQRLFAGTYFHELELHGGAIRIASKRVNLVNCDAALDVACPDRVVRLGC